MNAVRRPSLLRAARRLLAATADPLDAALDLQFRPVEGHAHREAWRSFGQAVARTGLPRQIVAYVHVPFCRTICSFCALAVEPSPDAEHLSAYVDGLVREAKSWRATLGTLEVATVHLGGGTPSLLSSAQLDRLLAGLREHLPLQRDAEWGVELLPNSTSSDKVRVLVDHGVRRASFGMQSADREVLRRAHRAYQSHEDVQRAVELTRREGIDDVNVDVLVGLPGETDASVEASVRAALALGTRSMSLNRNLAESSPLSAHGWVPSLEATRRTTERLRNADALVRELRPPSQPRGPVADPGYGVQYVWTDDSEARAYFQEDMNGPTSVLPLGHGATGHLQGMMYVIPVGTWQQWLAHVDAGEPHDVLAARITPRREMAAFVARSLVAGHCSEEAFARVFGTSLERVMGKRLGALAAEGALTRDGGSWRPAEGAKVGYLELLVALGEPGERLHSPPASPSRPVPEAPRAVAPARLPPPQSGDHADVIDRPDTAASIANAIADARAAGAARVTLWTTPQRLTDPAAKQALDLAPPDVLMLALGEDGSDRRWRRAALAAGPSCAVGVFIAWSGRRPDGELATLVDELAVAGAEHVLIELEEPVSAGVALRLWQHGARGRPELAVVFREPETAHLQYAHIATPIPDSIVISRIAFRAARANRRRDDGPLSRFQGRFGRPPAPRPQREREAHR